ncbi:unnamed protein product [Amoebophrya sp. A25]|nr:unnamed protein product [Amoebophrya sp. A25]|eukprot:GSA25T00023180001.1
MSDWTGWGPEAVGEWLRRLGVPSRIVGRFIAEKIDGPTLSTFTPACVRALVRGEDLSTAVGSPNQDDLDIAQHEDLNSIAGMIQEALLGEDLNTSPEQTSSSPAGHFSWSTPRGEDDLEVVEASEDELHKIAHEVEDYHEVFEEIDAERRAEQQDSEQSFLPSPHELYEPGPVRDTQLHGSPSFGDSTNGDQPASGISIAPPSVHEDEARSEYHQKVGLGCNAGRMRVIKAGSDPDDDSMSSSSRGGGLNQSDAEPPPPEERRSRLASGWEEQQSQSQILSSRFGIDMVASTGYSPPASSVGTPSLTTGAGPQGTAGQGGQEQIGGSSSSTATGQIQQSTNGNGGGGTQLSAYSPDQEESSCTSNATAPTVEENMPDIYRAKLEVPQLLAAIESPHFTSKSPAEQKLLLKRARPWIKALRVANRSFANPSSADLAARKRLRTKMRTREHMWAEVLDAEEKSTKVWENFYFLQQKKRLEYVDFGEQMRNAEQAWQFDLVTSQVHLDCMQKAYEKEQAITTVYSKGRGGSGGKSNKGNALKSKVPDASILKPSYFLADAKYQGDEKIVGQREELISHLRSLEHLEEELDYFRGKVERRELTISDWIRREEASKQLLSQLTPLDRPPPPTEHLVDVENRIREAEAQKDALAEAVEKLKLEEEALKAEVNALTGSLAQKATDIDNRKKWPSFLRPTRTPGGAEQDGPTKDKELQTDVQLKVAYTAAPSEETPRMNGGGGTTLKKVVSSAENTSTGASRTDATSTLSTRGSGSGMRLALTPTPSGAAFHSPLPSSRSGAVSARVPVSARRSNGAPRVPSAGRASVGSSNLGVVVTRTSSGVGATTGTSTLGRNSRTRSRDPPRSRASSQLGR